MKSETEFRWIVNLLNSPYVKGFWGSRSGCKRDFERISGSGEKNKYFRKWFNFLLECGAIEHYGDTNTHGKFVPGYVVIYKKLYKILIKNKLYISVAKIINEKYFGKDIKIFK